MPILSCSVFCFQARQATCWIFGSGRNILILKKKHPIPELAAEPGSCVPVGLFGDDAGVFASQKISNICQNTKNDTTHLQGTLTDMTNQNTLRHNNMQDTPNTMTER